MQLKHLVDLKGRLFAPYLDAGDGPFGTRYIYNAAEGTFEGPRLKGRFPPRWWRLATSGCRRDDASRHPSRFGDRRRSGHLLPRPHGVWRHFPSDEDGNGEISIVGTPRFETGDDRYQWLNDYVYVAEG